MKRLLVIAGWVFVLSAGRFVEAGTLFTNPVIFVQPTALNFGPVAVNKTATNTFLVENMGGGKVVGTATVAAPFKILSGGSYTLRPKEAQVITVTYTPSGAESDIQTVTFTGGGGATADATGTLKVPPSKKPKQK